jgi:D-glycero-alpha-D-manno-heptose-7-phosphate kinase
MKDKAMKIHAKAPNRIDLSGGTLDIYPLYVFLDGGYTLNAAIDLYSEVTLTPREDQRFVFHSQDLDLNLELSREELRAGVPQGDFFQLLVEIVRFYEPATGLTISTCNQAPKGSGLGASSALLIALSGALNQYNRTYMDGESLIQFGADLEARSLGIPTGKQDYYAALYGGLSAIHFSIQGIEHQTLDLDGSFIEKLNQSLLVSFTGQSHFSGTNNWSMLKSYVENQGNTREHLHAIRQTSEHMLSALFAEDLEHLIELINEEWHNRKALAEGVSTPQIENMMAAAREQGAWASKICGAGGGGCMLTLCPAELKTKVAQALTDTGAQVMHQKIAPLGLQVNVLSE